MTLLWIYDQPLRPEVGGTERTTALVAKGLAQSGHTCLGILQFRAGRKMVWEGEPVCDLYAFLKAHHVDIVINQVAYVTWLLDAFLESGGKQWKKDGGKIISCLHFAPKNPAPASLLRCKDNKTWLDKLQILKAIVLQPWYAHNQQKREGSIYNHIYERSDSMVALSSTHFPYLHKVMKRAEYSKLIAINNPLTFDDISTPDILHEKRKVVLVCARMSEYHKRISMTLKAWERIQKHYPISAEWILKLVGDGPELPNYREYVCRHQIPNIQFEGQQSPDPYYREASILLVTSSTEGWGLNITEALQRGVVPVIMNSSPVFCEIVEHDKCGFLTPDNNVKAFSERIVYLMEHDQTRIKMQLAALEKAKAYEMSATMEKWRKLLHNL